MVSPDAEIGDGCEIGPFSIVHAGVRLGSDSVVGSHCEIGLPGPAGSDATLEIGPAAVIRSHSVLYAGSTIGPELRTGHRVTMREGLTIGRDFQVGTLADLQGDATFGDHVRLHSNVHCGKLSEIGDFVWIFPYVVLTNDPHPPSDGFHEGAVIEPYAVVATSSVVLPGVRIGEGAFVGAHTLVRADVPPDTICVGVPGKNRGPTSAILLKDGSGPAYPWRRHFERGYPPEVVARWRGERRRDQ